jgi:hypothetical protein
MRAQGADPVGFRQGARHNLAGPWILCLFESLVLWLLVVLVATVLPPRRDDTLERLILAVALWIGFRLQLWPTAEGATACPWSLSRLSAQLISPTRWRFPLALIVFAPADENASPPLRRSGCCSGS